MKIRQSALWARAQWNRHRTTAAQAGYEVMSAISTWLLDKQLAGLDKLLNRSVEKGKLDEAAKAAILGRIKKTVDKKDFAGVDFMIEVVVENEEIKKTVLGDLDAVLKPDVVLASNTSSMSISKLPIHRTGRSLCGNALFQSRSRHEAG
jgi:3-hydroxybutyryl-CoA dehydrogenase